MSHQHNVWVEIRLNIIYSVTVSIHPQPPFTGGNGDLLSDESSQQMNFVFPRRFSPREYKWSGSLKSFVKFLKKICNWLRNTISCYVVFSSRSKINHYSPVSWSFWIWRLHLYWGVRPPPHNEYPECDTKLSAGEVPVLKLWGMESTVSLPLLPGSLILGVVILIRVLSMYHLL